MLMTVTKMVKKKVGEVGGRCFRITKTHYLLPASLVDGQGGRQARLELSLRF